MGVGSLRGRTCQVLPLSTSHAELVRLAKQRQRLGARAKEFLEVQERQAVEEATATNEASTAEICDARLKSKVRSALLHLATTTSQMYNQVRSKIEQLHRSHHSSPYYWK